MNFVRSAGRTFQYWRAIFSAVSIESEPPELYSTRRIPSGSSMSITFFDSSSARGCEMPSNSWKYSTVELAHDRVLHFLAVVADVHVPQARDAVDELAALFVEHVAAVAAHDADRLALLHLVRVQHRVPEFCFVVAHCSLHCRIG